jgi:hypothetical protein
MLLVNPHGCAAQVHKWLELTFVDGCREEVESQSAPHHHRHANAPLEQHRNLRQHNKGRFSDSAQVSTGRQAAYERSRAGIDTWESNTTWQAAWELGPTDLIASPARSARRVLRDGNYESDPRPDMEQVGINSLARSEEMVAGSSSCPVVN